MIGCGEAVRIDLRGELQAHDINTSEMRGKNCELLHPPNRSIIKIHCDNDETYMSSNIENDNLGYNFFIDRDVKTITRYSQSIAKKWCRRYCEPTEGCLPRCELDSTRLPALPYQVDALIHDLDQLRERSAICSTTGNLGSNEFRHMLASLVRFLWN